MHKVYANIIRLDTYIFIVKGYHRGCFISAQLLKYAPWLIFSVLHVHFRRIPFSAGQHKIHSAVPHKTSAKKMKLWCLLIVLQLLTSRSEFAAPRSCTDALHSIPGGQISLGCISSRYPGYSHQAFEMASILEWRVHKYTEKKMFSFHQTLEETTTILLWKNHGSLCNINLFNAYIPNILICLFFEEKLIN